LVVREYRGRVFVSPIGKAKTLSIDPTKFSLTINVIQTNPKIVIPRIPAGNERLLGLSPNDSQVTTFSQADVVGTKPVHLLGVHIVLGAASDRWYRQLGWVDRWDEGLGWFDEGRLVDRRLKFSILLISKVVMSKVVHVCSIWFLCCDSNFRVCSSR